MNHAEYVGALHGLASWVAGVLLLRYPATAAVLQVRPKLAVHRDRALPGFSIVCLNTGVSRVRLSVIPEQCRLGHPWGPGLVSMSWEPCDCPAAEPARGGHITVRCLAEFGLIGDRRCPEEWLAPRHQHVNRDPIGYHRPGYR